MEHKPPPYSPYGGPPYPGGPQHGAPYPSAPHPGVAPYPTGAPYPVGQPGFPQPQPMVHHPQAYQPPPPPVQPTTVVVQTAAAGVCPICRSGTVTKEFTCCGICCGILFFPIGLICCFCMMENRCSVCRASF